MKMIFDAWTELRSSLAGWLERTTESVREREQHSRLELWKTMQFEERMQRIYKDMQRSVPDAELVFVEKNKALIRGTNPQNGKAFEFEFLP